MASIYWRTYAIVVSSLPVWLVVFRVSIPKRDAHIYTKQEKCYDYMPHAKALAMST